MEEDFGYWNLFTLMAILLMGLPLTAVFLGIVLRLTRLRRLATICLLGGIGGYIGAATATFTSIGIAFMLYVYHVWHFPKNEAQVPTVMYVAVLAVFVIMPVVGLLVGGAWGVVNARRKNTREV